jgi:glycosyltransferase involved in cell wall biosynthesis
LGRLSAYIVTLNEEKRLPATLAALQDVADEIIVVDAGSKDATCEVTRSFGAGVYYRDWDSYCGQKRYAESLCSGEWLLNIDADEVISAELGREIKDALEKDEKDLYRLRIADIFPGQEKPNPWVKHYNIIRLYRSGYGEMARDFTHDRVQVTRSDARIGQLRHYVHHHSFVSINRTVMKYLRYTDQQVEEALSKRKPYSPFRMLFAINANFLKYFLLDRQFLNGWWGYIHSVNCAYLRFLKFAKNYEAKQKKHL